MNRTAEEIQDDLERLDYGDKEVWSQIERLRKIYKEKGIQYHELCRSKLFGTIKYLLVELQDKHGTVLITDLDTNATYSFVDTHPEPKKINRIQEWIQNSK